MFPFLIVIHTLICIALIIVVLMQSAKGEGLAGAFGGGSLTGAVFGGRGAASFLSKATTGLAIIFMISCLGLSIMSAGSRTTGTETAASAVATEMQKEAAAQAQQQQQQAAPDQGQQANPTEDLFNTPPAQPSDSK